MDPNQSSCSNQADEDYIEMEVSSSSSSSSSSTFFCCSISSPPKQTREFEFQMSTVSHERDELITSPADVLFYKGKLLPLHLPPRLQMVQNILQTNPNTKPQEDQGGGFEVAYRINNPSFNSNSGSTTTPSSTNTSTPLESCSISPSESCRVSCELNPDDEYLSQWATEMSVFIGDNQPKKQSWSTKLKQIKQTSLGQKIKQSRAYLKSLFGKPGCNSDGTSCAKSGCNVEESEGIPRGKNSLNKKNPFGRINNGRYQMSSTTLMKSIEDEMAAENHHHHHRHHHHHHHHHYQECLSSQRRSFSGVIPRQYSGVKSSCSSSTTSTSSSSSSSFSFSSNGSCYDSQLLKRSTSASSEIESSIEGAIAHCKQSNGVIVGSRKAVNGGNVNPSGVCSILSAASRIGVVCGDRERAGLCRI